MKSPVLRSTLALASAAVVSLSLAACGGSATGGDSAAAGDRTLRMEHTTDPTTFDPAAATAGDDLAAVGLLYDTLVSRDDDGTLIPGLAESWDAKSASQYVLTLEKGNTCADGTEITPSVVADSLNYFADPSSGTHVGAPLVFGQGKPVITGNDQAGTVTIKTAKPFSTVLEGLSTAPSAIICPAGLKDPQGLAKGSVEGAFSGAYVLADAKPGISYAYDLRDDYDNWPKLSEPLTGEPAKRLEFSLVTDQATTANKLMSGDLDVGNVTGETVSRFEGGDYNQQDIVIANVYVSFNERAGRPFADNPAGRKAVAEAIDRAAFNQVFSAGRNPLFNSVVPDTYQCALDDESLIEKHDPAAAAKALEGMKIKLVASNAFGDEGKGAEYLQKVLDDAGAQVDLTVTDNANWAKQTYSPTGDWDMTLMGDINGAKIVVNSLERIMGPAPEEGGRNLPANDNAVGAAEVQRARVTTDQDKQCAAYEKAQKSALERDDVVPMTGIIFSVTSQPDVTVRAPGGSLSYRLTRIQDS